MKKEVKKVVIVTPVFGASGTGASIYYQLLSSRLNESGFLPVIISDGDSLSLPPLKIYRLFPARCLRSKRSVMDLVLYFLQNITYLLIPLILLKERPGIIIIHSSFYNNVGAFGLATRIMMALFKKTRFILDVRDRMLPLSINKLITGFDCTVACSENVFDYLVKIIGEKNPIRLIPVIQETLKIDKTFSSTIRNEYSLKSNNYILSVGAVKEDKGTRLLLDSFMNYINPRLLNMPLVIVGMLKTNDKSILKLLSSDNVIYLGKLDRDSVISLMSDAAVCVNMSINEGMPRSSLEPLALGVKCVLPETVPEFVRCCSEFVCRGRTSKEVAQFIVKVIERNLYPKYPIKKHHQESVFPKYLDLLKEIND